MTPAGGLLAPLNSVADGARHIARGKVHARMPLPMAKQVW